MSIYCAGGVGEGRDTLTPLDDISQLKEPPEVLD